MTDNQKRAIDAIKAATGWDAEPSSQGAKVQRSNVTSIYVWWSRADKWKCEITPKGWTGEGATPEEAIEAVLPRYRAQIASLAADILPGWPHLQWVQYSESMYHLVLHVYGVQKKLMLVFAIPEDFGWAYIKLDRLIGPVSKDHVMLRAKEIVESAKLPCEVPTFPEIANAS